MIFLIRIVPFSDRQSYMNVMESLTTIVSIMKVSIEWSGYAMILYGPNLRRIVNSFTRLLVQINKWTPSPHSPKFTVQRKML